MPRMPDAAVLALCLRRMLLAATVVASVGCFTYDVPLDATPALDVDPALVGTWRCLPASPDSADDAVATIEVARKTDRVYAVTFRAPGEDPDRYEAHASAVKGATLLSVRELSKTNRSWVFARYAFLRPGVLEVQLVSDTLLKGVEGPVSVLRDALEKHLADPALFSDFCVCLRAKARMEESPR
jgi:hypothetical protein